MAKRLTKALRAKRRWIGLSVSGHEGRNSLEAAIKELAPVEDWQLMDFNGEFAILRIILQDETGWRQVLGDSSAPIHSVTMSGKIRLVRERLGLYKPQRR